MNITVVVPTRGPTTYLGEALRSIREDTSAATEVIVVEDGTTEVDESMLDGARLLRVPYVGRSLARNAGVEAATTELVAFVDADDVSLPGRFGAQAEALASSPGAGMTFGRSEVVDGTLGEIPQLTKHERERFDALLERGTGYDSLIVDCPIYTSGTMVHRDAFLAAGGYDRLLDAFEDLDLYLRLARDTFLVPTGSDAVALHRIHGANTPSPDLYAGRYHVARKHLPHAKRESARLLREWQLDSLWSLGDFRRARHAALELARTEPRLLAHGRFAKRLASASLPLPLLRSLRERRS
jgi:glycosyltransferase involved in cell wall biosynthesis